MADRPLRIGLTSCMMHPDPTRNLFKGKRLLYAEESLFHWVLNQGALAYLIPSTPATGVSLEAVLQDLDGIVMTGGADVSPTMYGEEPLKPEWAGDAHRDAYETEIIKMAMRLGKPILGVCRGLQIVNVALGGSLYQDISTQNETEIVHRDWEIYDANAHQLRIEPGSGLSRLYPGIATARINSVHHQGIKRLAKGLRAEGFSKADGIIECVRWEASDRYVFAIQWHPEWHDDRYPELLQAEPIVREFLDAARKARRSLSERAAVNL